MKLETQAIHAGFEDIQQHARLRFLFIKQLLTASVILSTVLTCSTLKSQVIFIPVS